MKNENAQQQTVETLSARQLFEFGAKCAGLVPKNMTTSELDKVGHSRRFKSQFLNILRPQAPSESPKILTVMDAAKEIGEVAEKYERLYRNHFGIEVDFSTVAVPDKRPGIETPLFIPPGLTCNQAYGICAAAFTCWRYTNDLDAAVEGHNDREPVRPYMIWTHGDQEPAEETGDISANRAVVLGARATILLEELVAERFFWEEYKQHRNVKNVTLCHGSRHADGSVPSVGFHDGRFSVDYCSPGYSDGHLRFRPAVS